MNKKELALEVIERLHRDTKRPRACGRYGGVDRVWLRQMDLMTGSMRCGVTLVHYGSGAAGRPHPTRACARPTFPLGEGFEKRRRRSKACGAISYSSTVI